MTYLIVMVGIQGSGKSTKAKEIAKSLDAVVLSSDEIRKDNPSLDNGQVFAYLYAQMNIYLEQGKSVIIDATNTTLKARQGIFNCLKVKPDWTIAYVMNTNEWECRERVEKRNTDPNEHYVSLDVLYRYVCNFQIPVEGEGFDQVTFDKEPCFDVNKSLYLIDETVGFDQKNHHHTFDLYGHTSRVGFSYGNLCVGLFHDIGKLFTQTFDTDGEAHYYNHANIGAYYLLTHLEVLPFDLREEVLAITNYHMLPYNWKEEKTHNKYKKFFGESFYNKLIKFHEADEGAH